MNAKLLFVIAFLSLLFLAYGAAKLQQSEQTPLADKANPFQEFQVPPPPFSEDMFPCTECHEDDEPDVEPRELEVLHGEIILKHDEQNRWCMDCHDALSRDFLRLSNGQLVPHTESYLLCGQCHGEKLRDWRVGIHGKRTGLWNGRKMYLLCAHCHNPHEPRFKKLAPLPIPVPPSELRASLDWDYESVDVPTSSTMELEAILKSMNALTTDTLSTDTVSTDTVTTDTVTTGGLF